MKPEQTILLIAIVYSIAFITGMLVGLPSNDYQEMCKTSFDRVIGRDVNDKIKL